MTITSEPLDDDAADAAAALPIEIRNDLENLYRLTYDDPAAAVQRLEPLIERFPGAAILLNYLVNALSRAGDHDKARAAALRYFELHPDYLFARCNWAHMCLSQKQWDAIPSFFGGCRSLDQLYPHRTIFHESEVAAFESVMIEYLCFIGEVEPAENRMAALRQIAPDHPVTMDLDERFEALQLIGCMKRAIEHLKQPRQRPRKFRTRAKRRKSKAAR